MNSLTQRQLLQFGGVLFVGLVAGYFLRDIPPGMRPKLPFLPLSCTYNGQTYRNGEGFRSSDGCNSCSCQNGQIACTLMACGQGGTGIVPDTYPGTSGGSGTVGIETVMPGESEFAKIPDLPISTMPTDPVSVSYVIEHRSALNGKTVQVTGVVVANWLKQEDPTGLKMGMYMQPSIFLADSASTSRNPLYDLRVLILEGLQLQEDQYMVGKTVTVWATAQGYLEGIVATYAAVADDGVRQ